METIEKLIESYQPSVETVKILSATKIVLCVGIVSAGKDTLQRKLVERGGYRRIITCTTRAPRVNSGVLETDGTDYHFLSVEEMRRRIENHEMIEINKFGSNFYGAHIDEFALAQNEGVVALGDIDVNGIASFRKIAPGSVTALFIVPPDYQTWRSRLRQRYTSEEVFNEEWQQRRNITIDELEHALSASYYHFIINDDLERATRVIDEIAHRPDEYNRRDDDARRAARQLLDDIRRNLP